MDERSARRNQETGCHNGLRGLAASQPRMRADTHDGPEQIAPLQRPDTLMQLSRSSILEVHLVRTAGPYILAQSGLSAMSAYLSAFGVKRTCMGVLLSPRRSRMTHICHPPINFAVMHKAVFAPAAVVGLAA